MSSKGILDDSPALNGTDAPMDEWDMDDEGWLWLPHEEVMALQREKNAIMRQMLDNVALISPPHRVVAIREGSDQC